MFAGMDSPHRHHVYEEKINLLSHVCRRLKSALNVYGNIMLMLSENDLVFRLFSMH